MILIDGRKAKERLMLDLKDKIETSNVFNVNPTIPCLAIIQVGNRPDSDSFIKSKKAFANKIGIKEIHINFPENANKKEIIDQINKFNKDKNIHGIIVQLPLPNHIDSNEIINKIDIKKDVDGLVDGSTFVPATARGISELFDFYKINIKNKKVTVIGRSRLVGTPIAQMCKNRGAKVSICHKETKDIPSITKKADIVIVAIGQPKFIDDKYFSKDQIVIDVGISRTENGIVGDVDFENVKDMVKMITPVPGGVGQMTVLALFENVYDAWYNANN